MDYTAYKQLEFRRKFWKIFGAEITVTDPASDQTVGFIKMKAWKLREDIRLYTDATMTHEIFRIGARQIIDFGATYDIFDSTTDQKLCSLRRKGLKSTFVRDHWIIRDGSSDAVEVGYVQETSGTLALLRRWIGLLPFGEIVELIFAFAPQTYEMHRGTDASSSVTARLTHRKNPFVVKMGLEMTDAASADDHKVAMAVAALLSVIDAAKNN